MFRLIDKPVKLVFVSCICWLVSGCSNTVATQKDLAKNMATSNQMYDKTGTKRNRASLVNFSKKPFLGSQSYLVDNVKNPLPKIFERNYSIATNKAKSLREYVKNLTRITGLKIYVSEDAISKLINDSENVLSNKSVYLKQDKIKYSVNFNGKIKGYLDSLTSLFQLSWKYLPQENRVKIFYVETQNFKLPVSNSDISDTSIISNSGANNNSKVGYASSSMNFFQDSVDAIKSMSSDKKNFNVTENKSFSMITVTATPRLMKQVSDYVNDLNKQAQKSVQVKISIYEVKTNKASNYGIDWNLMYNGTNAKINWSTEGLASTVAGGLTTATVEAGIRGGMWAGSNIVASAIQKNLDGSYVTGYTFYSLNGQSTPINNGQQVGYVSKLVTNIVAGGLSNTTSQSITQSALQTGFTGDVLSNVLPDDKIFLRLSIDVSKLINLQSVQYGTKEKPASIQIPNTEDSKVIQNIILKSGQTAVITGFTTTDSKDDTASLADKKFWWFGGNQDTNSDKETMVIIVSAYNVNG